MTRLIPNIDELRQHKKIHFSLSKGKVLHRYFVLKIYNALLQIVGHIKYPDEFVNNSEIPLHDFEAWLYSTLPGEIRKKMLPLHEEIYRIVAEEEEDEDFNTDKKHRK